MKTASLALAWLLAVLPCAAHENLLKASEPPGYTIITTSEITTSDVNHGSSKLGEFVAHKESLGFTVQVITEEDFGGGRGYVGGEDPREEAAEHIREWLKAHYISDNIEYVLLIGNPDPVIGAVPMKMLWPRNNWGEEPWTDAPSDSYYADLTGNWDLDEDGFYGEWPDANGLNGDFGPGGVDCFWEVLVGRIPCYGDINDLDNILQKTIAYEEQTQIGESIDWRKNVLLAMDSSLPNSYRLGEALKNEILGPPDWSCHRIYDDDFGLTPPPETMPCDINNVLDVWNGYAANSEGKFGLVVWASHGGRHVAVDVMDIDHVVELNDSFPSFTFQITCSNAEPEETDNVAYELLKNGAICTVGATRPPGVLWSKPFLEDQRSGGLAYRYVRALVIGLSCGQALHDIKQRFGPYSEVTWHHAAKFNIYGDPSLHLVPQQHPVIYVDAKAGGLGDGSCWTNACNFLQDGLAKAHWRGEIRVAQGTYRPDEGVGVSPQDRTASFSLKDGVTIRGGYAGFAEPGPNIRDIRTYETILSGDIGLADVNIDNSYHVVTGSGTYETTVLEGFTITAGNADGNDANSCGGGIHIYRGSPTIRDCIIRENTANTNGGGINVENGTPRIVGCNITDNRASYGGGIHNQRSSPEVSHCTFSRNWATSGGGINNTSNSSPILTHCTFNENQAANGGGMRCNGKSNTTVSDCIFIGNDATHGGGLFAAGSAPSCSNCTFTGNSSSWGGGVYIKFCNGVELKEGCKLINNRATARGGGMFVYGDSHVTMMNCLIVENCADMAGAMYISRECDVELLNCTFTLNSARRGNTLVYASAQLPSTTDLINCIIWDGGEQIWNADDSTISIVYSDVRGGWEGEGTGNIDADPLFADPNKGDYHLKSQPGRWDPNPPAADWVKDDVTSPCIDAGDTNSDWTVELWPHGKRINMGAYGGTPEASMSPSTVGNIADLNNDDLVDYRDMTILTSQWPRQEILLREDLDRNGWVGFVDFCIFADNWLWQE